MTFDEYWTFDAGVGDPITFRVKGEYDQEDNWVDLESVQANGLELYGFLAPRILEACERELRARFTGRLMEIRR